MLEDRAARAAQVSHPQFVATRSARFFPLSFPPLQAVSGLEETQILRTNPIGE
jgi:hypothetical protein